jgi:uncharacterized protein (TIGR02001 family)
MKRKVICLAVFIVLVCAISVNAQEESSWTTGVDLYSSYVWRGMKIGSGPALQPSIEFSTGGLTLGAWGSYCFTENEAMETDLYAGYEFTLGENSTLGLTLTDYYYPGTKYFTADSHFFEPMVNLGLGKFSFTGAYMMGTKASDVKDKYFEAAFDAGSVKLTLGAGDGQYTKDGNFNVCNIGLSTTKTIKVTDSFSIPVNGALILNPSSESLFIVVGISL